MTVYEVITIALIALLAAGTTAAIWAGLRGMARDLYVVRCNVCNHLMFSNTEQPQHNCSHCRHTALWHPLHAIHFFRPAPILTGHRYQS